MRKKLRIIAIGLVLTLSVSCTTNDLWYASEALDASAAVIGTTAAFIDITRPHYCPHYRPHRPPYHRPAPPPRPSRPLPPPPPPHWR